LATAAPYGVFYRHPRQTVSSLATLALDTAAARSCPEPHVARVPRVVLDRQALPFAAAEFAAGLIDRAELMRRIMR
jgi:hypothetical protein